MTTTLVFIAGFVILFVALIIFVLQQEKKRTEALKQASLSLGFSFEPEGNVDEMRGVADLRLFSLGRSREIRNVMGGRSGTDDVRMFDYLYTVGHGKQSSRNSQTVALYPGRGRGLPDFVLTPENFLTRLGEKMGAQDIDFESSPGFSSQYRLQGPNEEAIRSAFSDQVRQGLEHEPGWSVEVKAGHVAIFKYGVLVKPENLFAFLEQSRAVLRTICPR